MNTNGETRLMELSALLLPVRPKPTDSAARLLALGRVYVALFRLVTATGRDSDFGDRRKLIGLGDLLSSCLLCRARREEVNIPERAALIAWAFRLAGEVTLSYDAERENDCREAVVNLLTSRKEALAYSSVLCCLTDYFYPCTEADKGDPWYIALRQAVNRWSETFSKRAGWQGIGIEEALSRIDVMSRCSCLSQEEARDEVIREAFAYYRSAIHIYNMPFSVLFRLYDLALQGMCYPVDQKVAWEIGAMVCASRKPVAGTNDERLLRLSLEVDVLCESLLAESEMEIACL